MKQSKYIIMANQIAQQEKNIIHLKNRQSRKACFKMQVYVDGMFMERDSAPLATAYGDFCEGLLHLSERVDKLTCCHRS